jgi:hypothetical protein
MLLLDAIAGVKQNGLEIGDETRSIAFSENFPHQQQSDGRTSNKVCLSHVKGPFVVTENR